MARKKPKHKVFVYGTLRNSREATHTLDGYAMFSVKGEKNDFPFIQDMGDRLLDEFEVLGNVIEVDDAELEQLDRYEGVANGLYERIKVEIENIEGEEEDTDQIEEAWVYVAGPALAYPLIQSGDWFNR